MTDEVYDLHQGWNSLAAELLYACMEMLPAKELAFYERRIRANGGTALDQACGTGRHLFPLLARGLEVHGARHRHAHDVFGLGGGLFFLLGVHP